MWFPCTGWRKKSCDFVNKIRINILLYYAPALILRITTLGGTGFSCAVSGFGQVLKKLTPACSRRSSSSHARKKPLIPRLLLEWIPVKAWQTGKNRKTSQKIRVKLAMSLVQHSIYYLLHVPKPPKLFFCTRNKAILTLESKIMQLLQSPSLFWFSFPFTYAFPSQGIFSFSVVTLLE